MYQNSKDIMTTAEKRMEAAVKLLERMYKTLKSDKNNVLIFGLEEIKIDNLEFRESWFNPEESAFGVKDENCFHSICDNIEQTTMQEFRKNFTDAIKIYKRVKY